MSEYDTIPSPPPDTVRPPPQTIPELWQALDRIEAARELRDSRRDATVRDLIDKIGLHGRRLDGLEGDVADIRDAARAEFPVAPLWSLVVVCAIGSLGALLLLEQIVSTR